jgi:hypothetical protein
MQKLIFLSMFLLTTILMVNVDAANPENFGRFTISGYIKDAENGEILVGATVFVKELKGGTAANQYGFYSVSLQPGEYTLVFSFVGYNSIEKKVSLSANQSINIEMAAASKNLEEVVVKGERADANVTKAEMGTVKLDIKTINKIPALMGEVDVVKVVQMLPGVQPTAEGTSGFSVRGGNNDQNLILLDEATVYNASHLMGFFSVFNNDAIRDVKLYKGDIPSNYGGRLASVLDVKMKDGNSKKFSGQGGVGLISSRLTLEGPIAKDKASFLVAGRRTYADLFFRMSSDSGLRKSQMYFYDLNGKMNWEINQNNKIFLSAYGGRDKFGQKGLADAGFGNVTGTLRWNHLFTERLFSNTSLIASQYSYDLSMNSGSSTYVWKSNMVDYSLKIDFNYFLTPQNELKFGLGTTYHQLDPCQAYIEGERSTLGLVFPKNYSLEHFAYITNQQQIGDNLTLKYGVRLSMFQNMGATTTYSYDQNYQIKDTFKYSRNEIYHTFPVECEPRLGVTYVLNSQSSVKASYTRTVQYMQQASTSNGGMPLDVWFSASANVKPQKADQFSVGYFRNFFDNQLETSVETFYKDMKDVVDFEDHAELLMNPYMEGEIRTGKAKAYGVEVLIRKNEGRLNGWVSYTYSRVKRTISAINDGKEYSSPYDKPHNVNIILSYDFNKRVSVSANWIYSTGTPITFPTGSVYYNNTYNKIYSTRNGYRMRDYHRLDLSMTLKNKNQENSKWKGEWVFSVYNAYGRHNDWMLNFQEETNPKKIMVERTYLPFVFFPAVTYNFHF